jgi:hypothetical protein
MDYHLERRLFTHSRSSLMVGDCFLWGRGMFSENCHHLGCFLAPVIVLLLGVFSIRMDLDDPATKNNTRNDSVDVRSLFERNVLRLTAHWTASKAIINQSPRGLHHLFAQKPPGHEHWWSKEAHPEIQQRNTFGTSFSAEKMSRYNQALIGDHRHDLGVGWQLSFFSTSRSTIIFLLTSRSIYLILG